jgi:sugar phosphate isomerase/epimerase
MKAKVKIERFRDKYTKKIYTKGNLYEGTLERIEELQAKNWLGDTIKTNLEKDNHLPSLDGTVDEIKSIVDGLTKSDYEKLISLEKEGKNRKGLVEFLEEQSKLAGLVETPSEDE